MSNQFSRTEMLLGTDALNCLQKKRVAVFGLGGVGGYTAEALVRAGIGAIDLIDNDTISLTNLNRQLFATHKTIGCNKVDVAKARLKEINPKCLITTHKIFYLPDDNPPLDFKDFDYIVDAIDTITAKIGLVIAAKQADVPIISSMGTGNKLTPEAFEVADIYKTSVCPLAHVMRKELKKRDIKSLKVVYSKEKPLKPVMKAADDDISCKRAIPGSVSFVPPVAGLIMAKEVIKDLISDCND